MIVIDEITELMMTVQAEVEAPIAMLAQKRAPWDPHHAGDAAAKRQRDRGVIKANFPSRIAFRVASQVD